MIGIVQKVEFTKNGSKKVSINGGWYFAGKVNVDGMKPGDKVEFEFSEFGEDRGKGRLKGLTKWRHVTNGATGVPETASTITDADILRSVSNVVGSACAAGSIKEPEQLEKWFCAAWAGFTRRQKSATGKDPELDDDLPDGFYGNGESENPAPNGDDPGW